MAYQDRCMMKWQGFMLSEHSEDIQLHNRKKVNPIELDEQTILLFNEMLLNSYKSQLLIEIEYYNPNNLYEQMKAITGYVCKFNQTDHSIQLIQSDGIKGGSISIHSIQSVREV